MKMYIELYASLMSLLPPAYFFIGSLRLSPDRLLMLILFVPMAFTGKCTEEFCAISQGLSE